jgi:putative ABC transport system permease protein
MFKNYLKIAWRNLKKNKVFSFINIMGLTIGITCCMLIFLYIMNEFSVDSFHKDGDRMFRVMRAFEDNTSIKKVPYLSGPYAKALTTDYPDQVKKVVRVMPSNGLVSIGTTAYNEKNVYVADAGFFSMFSFPLVKGDAASVLKDPASVVLTESTAKKYFGKEDPIGKTIELDKSLQLKVTGVAKDAPVNTHMNFDMVVPLSNWENQDWMQNWPNNNLFTYVTLGKSTDQQMLEKDFPRFMEKYMGAQMKQFGMHFSLSLRPIRDIYFEPTTSFDTARHGDKKMVYVFICIAVLILLIACINFTNLSTLRAVERSKEVGLRKVMGALRNNLVWQFIGEAMMLTVISCILSVALLQLLTPVLSDMVGYKLAMAWNAWPVYLFFLGVVIIVGLLSGSYPAFFLSAFSPIEALKGKLKLGKGGAFFRQGLVVVQFSISVLLIIAMIVIVTQMRYVKNMELGYDKGHSLLIRLDNDAIGEGMNTFKNKLQMMKEVESVSMMSGEPGGFHDIHNFEAEGEHEPILKMRTGFADFEYVKTLGLKVIAGRDLSSQFPTDTTDAVLINRTAASMLGYTPEQSIGKWIRNRIRDSTRRRVVGVVEDFNFLSLKDKMDALVISPNLDRRVAVVKIRPGNMQATLSLIKQEYNQVAPVYPFEYTFLDQQFDRLYRKDIQQQAILTVFAGLAIFIACLGLFGLASFTAAKRTKEIGVRKVIGSSAFNIVVLLSKDLLKPVMIATLIAIPAGYYLMSNWLQNYAYRIPIHWWIFALAALLAAFIAIITVSFQAFKAAMVNPVKSLRSE